ncbi:LuxR C-terminal-related transcriptional regulator [Paenibacillus alvei]|uniref:Two component transcriptional regulator, LuxR family n=1 Tax=Paenibacillus alvei TaxID=44250 RepID=A0A383R5S7_PAEAL|nr:response regulator transcription factor [Paenibacillus alvei]SYX81884.1 Two component transcriptional regulator, LuxR family [Paenibacillus alvei]
MHIILIDDHALFAKSLEIALEGTPEIERFQSVTDTALAVSVIIKEQPDIILMDIHLNSSASEDGIMLAKKVLREIPNARIVMLTGYDLPVYRYEAQKIGAKGFLNKNMNPEEVVRALLQIQNGETYFPASIDFIETLTDSEKQILQLLSDGYKRKEIAGKLHISERTVSNHLQHTFEKLNVTSSLEAVAKGIQFGYIQPTFKMI